jgi:hypothetical protein
LFFSKADDKEEKSILTKKIEELSVSMEKMKLAEYIELLNNPKRMLYLNFLSGLARGIGAAIGFTILGAFVVLLLKKLVLLNIPVIGDFVAEIVRLVQYRLGY